MVTEQEFLPPAAWFKANGHSSLVYAVYELGKTRNDLRSECVSFQSSNFIPSRNEMRWRSHPEASLSNFLYARGITHEAGTKYPDDYVRESGLMYGYYYVRFIDKKATGLTWKVGRKSPRDIALNGIRK